MRASIKGGKMNHVNLTNKLAVASFSLNFLALTACGGGGGGSSAPAPSSTTPTAAQSQTQTPTNPYASACADIQGCVTVANGFQFPDGAGGTVSCVSGKCTDANSNLTSAQASYNSGYNAGVTEGQSQSQTTSYNNGYAAGQAAAAGSSTTDTTAAYNNGYSAGQTSGYNSGYNAGNTDGYNSGYNAGSSSGYNSGYSDGYSAGSGDSSGQYSAGYNAGYNDGYSAGYSSGGAAYGSSVIGSSKDTDLKKAQAQHLSLEDRANGIAQQMGMSVESAISMVQLTDQVKQMALAGQMTAADRMAIANSALKIAGVSTDEVNTAIASAMKGDMSSANDLMDKAAKNLGMASGADVRDKLVPSLGLVMP
jgi:flagellar biosynthesis/type III secretory pathway protein FliH